MLPQFPPSTAQTVFFDATSGTAALVTKQADGRNTTEMKFSDPHTALTWCIEHNASFVFIPADHSGN